MGVLNNVVVTTARRVYNATTGAAPPPTTWLTIPIPAHIEELERADYIILEAQGVEADYWFSVDVGTDILPDDQITNIVRIDTGTPWPGPFFGVGAQGQSTYTISLVWPSSPGFFDRYKVYVKRAIGGGPGTVS